MDSVRLFYYFIHAKLQRRFLHLSQDYYLVNLSAQKLQHSPKFFRPHINVVTGGSNVTVDIIRVLYLVFASASKDHYAR